MKYLTCLFAVVALPLLSCAQSTATAPTTAPVTQLALMKPVTDQPVAAATAAPAPTAKVQTPVVPVAIVAAPTKTYLPSPDLASYEKFKKSHIPFSPSAQELKAAQLILELRKKIV